MKNLLIAYGYTLLCIITLQILACIYVFISIYKSEIKMQTEKEKTIVENVEVKKTSKVEWSKPIIGYSEGNLKSEDKTPLIGICEFKNNQNICYEIGCKELKINKK
jgi:hypothetical protein